MKYMRAMLLGAALIGGTVAANAQSAVVLQWQRGYGNDGYYGRDGYRTESPRRIGYQDGFNDGLSDRRTGHSYRPTHDGNYRHADRGYNYSFGSKGYYKQIYREGYEQGYSQGYNTRPWYRR
jgi:hypothetical protein